MNKELLNEVSSSLESTLVNSDLAPVTLELAEMSLDCLFSDGLLKDIPILSTLVGVSKTAKTIRDQLFLKKIIYFLTQLTTIPRNEREEAIKKIDQSEKYRIRVGEKLLYIIDRSEDHRSAEVVAMLFSSFLKQKITYSEFLKASVIVNNVFIDDLIEFVHCKQEYHFRADDIRELLNSGLFDIDIDPIDVRVEDQNDNRRTEKYKTEIEGGELSASISSIGKIIKDVLKDRLF